MQSVDVCVVGAGPGGALLSLLLAKKGLSVLLVERTGSIAKAFRGEHVNEEGEAILKKHGLFEAVEKRGLLRMERLEYWLDGECTKTIHADPQIGHLGIHVPQAHLLEAIMNEAQQYSNFQLHLNSKVRDLMQDEKGVYTGIIIEQAGQESVMPCKLIIGADGRFSTVRKIANIQSTVRKHGYDLLWARIPTPEQWDPTIRLALVEGRQIALFTQAKGYVQIGWQIEQGSFSKLRKESFTPFIERLIQAFPELAEMVQTHIQSWNNFVLLDVFSSQVEEWGKDGLMLLGDAVHTMTPTGAYGLNSALKDADILAKVIDQGTVKRLDAITCATERQKEVAQIQAQQIEKEQSFASQFAVYA